MAKRNGNGNIQTPKVTLYGTLVGLTLVVFWVVAPALATTGRAGWLLVAAAVYTLLLMVFVAKAQAESDKLAAIRRVLRELKDKK